MRKFAEQNVARAFDAFDPEQRKTLLRLRELIFETAAQTKGVGRLQETLKWGQPSYLTPATKSGSTIRLGVTKSGEVAVFTHCQTTLMSEFQEQFPTEFTYEGNRAVYIPEHASTDKLAILVRRALTYHLKH